MKEIKNRLDQIHSEIVGLPRTPDLFMSTFMKVAYAFEGLEEEKGNRGYWHDIFARELNAPLGIPYCQAWVEYVAKLTATFLEVNDPFPSNTASSQNFFEWAKKNNLVSNEPDFGAIVVWRDGKSWRGHVGIVTTHDDSHFYSIEANTSNPLSQWRDGRYIMMKKHSLKRIGQISEGRWIRGFVDTKKAYEIRN